MATYYPYLRGKQFELLALRAFSNDSPGNQNICPIIEPVRTSFSSIGLAVGEMLKHSLQFACVLNPEEGEFKHQPGVDLLHEVSALSDSLGSWIPAYIYRKENDQEILAHARSRRLEGIMIIAPDSLPSDSKIVELARESVVSYIVISPDDTARRVKIDLQALKKTIIRLDDKFNAQKKNADYLNMVDEAFSEEPFYHHGDGYDGFADYTTLPKTLSVGGMLPYAVAIHLTYLKSDDSIHIHHFVSNTNDSTSDIPKKFFEAVQKVEAFYANVPQQKAITTLINMLNESKYPGLGTIKKLSIHAHLELMDSIINKLCGSAPNALTIRS